LFTINAQLDLGSGSGVDCYVASALVGEKGSVVGVDFSDEQLATARAHVDACRWERVLS
jgi:ubiquinone/menaquinone biosynthesis C-methylase UbiE